MAAPGFGELARRAGTRLGAALAGAGDPSADTGERRELLVLWQGEDPYALPVERVREIVRLRPVTPMPRVPDAVRGVISLRGEIVQVLDLRRRLGLAPMDLAAAGRRARIVVVYGEEGQASGLLVDRVSEVLRIGEEALHAPAARESDAVVALAPYGDRFVSLFDVDRLLDLGRRLERPPGAAA